MKVTTAPRPRPLVLSPGSSSPCPVPANLPGESTKQGLHVKSPHSQETAPDFEMLATKWRKKIFFLFTYISGLEFTSHQLARDLEDAVCVPVGVYRRGGWSPEGNDLAVISEQDLNPGLCCPCLRTFSSGSFQTVCFCLAFKRAFEQRLMSGAGSPGLCCGLREREHAHYSQLTQERSRLPTRGCSSCMLFVYKKLINKQFPRIHQQEKCMDLILLQFNLF